DGFEESVERVSYVTYFAHCLANVPANIPFEHGALWLGAVQHSLAPRFLFPNKPTIDDSVRTAKYTGMEVAGRETGASIGIGYMAESSIALGRYGMFAPIFLLGLFFGLVYRVFMSRKREHLLGMACALAILVFGAYTIETSNTKLVGGNALGLLVLLLFH